MYSLLVLINFLFHYFLRLFHQFIHFLLNLNWNTLVVYFKFASAIIAVVRISII